MTQSRRPHLARFEIFSLYILHSLPPSTPAEPSPPDERLRSLSLVPPHDRFAVSKWRNCLIRFSRRIPPFFRRRCPSNVRNQGLLPATVNFVTACRCEKHGRRKNQNTARKTFRRPPPPVVVRAVSKPYCFS